MLQSDITHRPIRAEVVSIILPDLDLATLTINKDGAHNWKIFGVLTDFEKDTRAMVERVYHYHPNTTFYDIANDMIELLICARDNFNQEPPEHHEDEIGAMADYYADNEE